MIKPTVNLDFLQNSAQLWMDSLGRVLNGIAGTKRSTKESTIEYVRKECLKTRDDIERAFGYEPFNIKYMYKDVYTRWDRFWELFPFSWQDGWLGHLRKKVEACAMRAFFWLCEEEIKEK